MTNAQQTHPSPEQLAEYARGILDEASDQKIEVHLSECNTCCETLNCLPEDTFVEILRDQQSPAATDPTLLLKKGKTANKPGKGDASQIPSGFEDHPRYRIVELIGEGGMGAVYKAEHRKMHRTVALKLINPQLVKQRDAVERFEREVQAAAKLSHPNIVTAHDAGHVGPMHFLVMEYVEGTDLADVVQQQGPLPIDQACDYIRQAALGLQHAHEKGMVHRDIKPHNLMVAKSQESSDQSQEQDSRAVSSGSRPSTLDSRLSVKILDFGLASFATETLEDVGETAREDEQAASAQLTMAGAMMGTPDFMSPEQANDARSADIRSDIYALGTTLYYLLAGHAPFQEGNVMQKLEAHRHQDAKPINTVRTEVPAELADVIRRMMAKDPAERYQTPAEVADALAPFVDRNRSHIAPQARPADSSWHGTGGRVARRSIWHRVSVTAIVLLLLFGAAGAVYYITTNNGTLQIRTRAADVEVIVRQNGEIVEIIDTRTDSHIIRLPTGKYEVELKGNNEFEISRDHFVLRRGERVIVDVKNVAQGRRPQSDKRQNVLLRDFAPTLATITTDGVASEQGGWRIDARQNRTVRLFEQPLSNIDDGVLFYRAKLKTKDLTGRAYLEMWVRLPGSQEYFSKGLNNAASGTQDWTEYEIPFKLEPGQYPGLVKLNLNVEGAGTVWIKDVELRASTTAKNIKVIEESKRTEAADDLAANGSQKGKLAGLQYVTRDYMAAVVINPQRILNKPIADTAKLYLSQLFQSDLGIEMKDVEQVVLLIPAASPNRNRQASFDLAAIIRLHPLGKVNANNMVDRILDRPQRVTEGPYVFYVDDQGNGAFVADNRTLVRAPRNLLLRMAASTQPRGMLAETLRDANLSSDVVGVVVNAGLARQGLYVAAATARSQLPPELAEQLSRAPDSILSATVAMDLSPGAPISLTVKTTNDDAAEMLTRLGKAGLVETRARLTELGATRIPTATIDPEQLALRTAFELIGTATTVQKGDQVVMSTRTPSGLADVVMSSVIMRAKKSATDAKRKNQLKQLGLAMHNYHDTHKSFPPAKHVPGDQFDKDGKPLLSWRVHILPYLSDEAAQLYHKFHLNESWNSEHNRALLDPMPRVFKTTDSPTMTTMLAVVGPGTIYEGKRGAEIKDVTDGTSNTILAVLAGNDKAVPWTKPEDLPLVEQDPITALGDIAGDEFQVAFCDGSVQTLHKEIDPETLKAMLIRNDGKTIDRNRRRPKRPAAGFLHQNEASTSDTDAVRVSVVVNVRADGTTDFEDRKLTLEELKSELKSLRTKTQLSVVISADRAAPVQAVTDVVTGLRSLGIRGVTVRNAEPRRRP